MPGPYPPSLPPDRPSRGYTRRAVLHLATAGSFAHVVTPQRLSAQGYADTRPASPLSAAGSDAASQARARSENRRVVIRIH